MNPQRLVLVLTGVNLALLASTLACAGPRLAHADAAAPVLRARAIELVDEGGRVRAKLNVESSGDTMLRLMDARGAIRVKLGASEDGAGLVLLNDAAEVGVHVLAERDGTSLRLRDKGGRERVIAP